MIALDLFAGTGWGVACQRLGIEEYGVEIMPEAVSTRTANGMHTIYGNVWEGLVHDAKVVDEILRTRPEYQATLAAEMVARGLSFREIASILIASPPCQTFSMAGGGAGRRALDDVLEAIEIGAYLDPAALREFGEKHDPRTALVLTPLAHVARDAPMYVVFEQVPPVLPVWERCAEEMRRWGYSVWTGNLQAEQYGVPQTRKRAILIARADGIEAAPPTPTHSRYYAHAPSKLDEGVLPWVSMAEALGWTPGSPRGGFEFVSNQHTSATGERYRRDSELPSPTITGGQRSARIEAQPGFGVQFVVGFARKADDRGAATADGYRARDLRADNLPAQHVTEKVRSWTRRPATTVQGDPRIFPPGHKVNGADRARLGDEAANERYGDRAGSTAERVTVAEAAALQSYPPGFEFSGTKTRQFLQVGNAVPPLLAEAILRCFIS